MTVPLQLLDNILSLFTVGEILLIVLGLTVLGLFVLRSWTVAGLTFLLFGIIFLSTPASVLGDTPVLYKMFGAALIVFGPLVYTMFGG